MTQALVALGSNLASQGRTPETMLVTALTLLRLKDIVPISLSNLYSTPAFPAGSGPDFVNAVITVETGGFFPDEVLARLHEVEASLGRQRSLRWGARTVDLDLLAMEGMVLPDAATWRSWYALPLQRQQEAAPEELILPHPRLQDRAFVLVPMADIAPSWRHPVLGLTVGELLVRLPPAARREVVPLSAAPEGWRV